MMCDMLLNRSKTVIPGICLLIMIFITGQVYPQQLTTETYHERLFYLCKAWGHMKYYHSEIAKKNINWDDELLVISRAAKTESNSEFSESLLQMLTAPGETEKPTDEPPVVPDSLRIVKDTSWIYNTFFTDTSTAIYPG